MQAKRDPYRFRFPIELRFVDPNIDDMIFHRFEHPPIFARPGDDDLDEVAVSWLFLFLWSVVFESFIFSSALPFFFFILHAFYIVLLMCILLSSVGSLLAMVLYLLFNFSKDLSYPKI
jgi:hypothetical protein